MQELNSNVTLDDLVSCSKQCWVVKMKKRTGQPLIHIYRRRQKSLKVMPQCPMKIHQLPSLPWNGLIGKIFQGSELKSFSSRKKPREGRVMPPPLRGGPGDPGGPGGPMGCMGGHGGDRGGISPRGPRGSRGKSSRRGNVQHLAGDWQCPNPGCGNQDLA